MLRFRMIRLSCMQETVQRPNESHIRPAAHKRDSVRCEIVYGNFGHDSCDTPVDTCVIIVDGFVCMVFWMYGHEEITLVIKILNHVRYISRYCFRSNYEFTLFGRPFRIIATRPPPQTEVRPPPSFERLAATFTRTY